jgi:ribosomal protein S18 acetylase RimI-like enzyme
LRPTATAIADPPPLALRVASPDDLIAIMSIERMPGFERQVGRSEEAEHRAMLASPAFAYRLGVGADGAVEAFAILRGLGDPHRNLYLKRVAVVRPGEGVGTAFLRLVVGEAFGRLGAERFYLDCFADNARAQAAYAKLGFTRDGTLRKAYRGPDGTRADLTLMALLKSEWLSVPAGGGAP